MLLFYDVGGKRYFAPMIPTNCSALRAPAILKHLKSAFWSLGREDKIPHFHCGGAGFDSRRDHFTAPWSNG